ncbi:MAG: cyclic nucleotide-binding domain-containing protein [Fuerstiella sp.]|nr:cyclic nucleotide-binding domain-containing protein [Fuerstiella sp.]MCP4856527.1 cyclic nucleotide-binding domain-containing protein [Fuerstiella sp.]
MHRANHPFDSVFMLVHGRVKQSLIDGQGNVIFQRYQTSGGQMGAMAAALGEPSPVNMVAEEPTTLLKLNHQKAIELTRQHEVFRANFSRLIADSVRNLLLKDRHHKKPALVVVFHESPATRPLTRQLINRLKTLGENPCVLNDQTDWQPMEDVPYCCLVQDGVAMVEQDVREQVHLWSDSNRIFIDASSAYDPARASNLVEVSDKVLWCVTPENWKASVYRLNAIEERAPGWRDKINIVWLLDDGSQWAPLAPELKKLAKRDYKISFDAPRANQNRALLNGIERIVHQLRGVRIGVALGGGAARGMAHLGVLKVLEQNGIIVDMIAGTSAGAMAGILYASGLDADYTAQRFVEDLTPSWFFRHIPRGGHWYLLYKYRRGQFDPMLRKYLHESQLQQLPIPVHAITVDLVSGRPIVRTRGDAVHAITESINLPVLSAPINRDGMALVDGGIVNNVPADVLVSKGCNFIIAVSVTAKMEQVFASNDPSMSTANMKSASTLQTILRTYVVQNVNMNSVGVQPADFVIEPDVTEFDITEFMRTDEISEIGARCTEDSVPELMKMLEQVDRQLFATG